MSRKMRHPSNAGPFARLGALASLLAVGAVAISTACGSISVPPESNPGDDGGGYPPNDGAVTDSSVPRDGQVSADSSTPSDGSVGSDATPDAGQGGDAAPVSWVSDPASHVNTLVGTTAGGNMFPGPDVPFGMIQWSPDTAPDRSEGGGYEYNDSQIGGFSLTHISGPGCGAMGDIPILPMTGGLPSGDPNTYTVPFSHTGEVATAGYYSVQSGSPAITTELTATLHSAMGRFTFPATNNANFLIKLLGSQNGSSGSSANIVGTNEVNGSTQSGHFCGAGDQYTLFFDIVFDQPFTASQIITPSGKSYPGEVFLTFDTTQKQVIQAKVAISFVSTDNARANWKAENADGTWDFDSVKTAAISSWNTMLGQIQIAGGSSGEQELFYTSLYHSLLHPNVFSDTNGQYMGFDNQVHSVSAPQKDQYANYSSWDIYHSQVQLSATVAPQQMSDSAQSMINDAAQNSGMLPKWSLANGESYVMVGDPSDGIIAGYYAFGAKNFDTATALSVMLKEATTPNNIRPGLDYYMNNGYLPDDGSYGCCNFYGSVATLLEYCEADFALSQFAAAVGDMTNANMLLARSQNWQNVFDPGTNFMTPKLKDGSFVPGIGLTTGQGMVEGTASQYRWIISYDRQAQIAAMGGPSAINPLLDAFYADLNDFSGKGALLSNEFELGAQYWDNYTGQPWKTQDIVNRVRTQVYQDTPSFMNNNDDLGALSSQLVWSMLGVFPVYPGSPILTINGPEFTDVQIHLPSGKSLTMHADGASTSNPYIQSLTVNGQPSTQLWLDPSVLDNGATLDFTMGPNPNMSWGVNPTDAPPSYGMSSTSALAFVATNPIVVAPGATTQVTIGAQSTRYDMSQTMNWTVSPTGSVQVSPASGTFSLMPGAQATQSLTVTGPGGEGSYPMTLKLSAASGPTPPSMTMPIIVAAAGSIWPYFNNAGISDDSNGGAGNFDGVGYSYSAQALAAAGLSAGGTISVGGITYKWPHQASGTSDNILLGGQTINLGAGGGHATIGLLGSATNAGAGGAQGTLTVTYADNSTQQVTITFSDWTLGAGSLSAAAGDTIAAKCAYRNAGGNKDNVATYVFAFTAALNSTQPVKSLTFPASSTGGDIHVFDIELN
jgi:predicted alpha-1,2-mannosidase